MACGLALKRPHEYDSYLADESFPHEAKRARQTAAHCSPFRPQMGTIAANLPSTSSFAQAASKVCYLFAFLNPHAVICTFQDDSPFAAVAGKCQLSESQLDAYLRSEVRSGQRRKLLPRRSCVDVKVEDENTPRKEYRTPNSPPQVEHFCSRLRKVEHIWTDTSSLIFFFTSAGWWGEGDGAMLLGMVL